VHTRISLFPSTLVVVNTFLFCSRPGLTRSFSTDTGRWGSNESVRSSSPNLNRPSFNDDNKRPSGGYGVRPSFNRSNSSRRIEDNIRRGFWHPKTGFKPAASDPQVELNLFGGEKMSTGINFEKYNDIPVEMSGDDLPSSVNTVSVNGVFLFISIKVVNAVSIV
jgi:hypothetical protein